MSTTKKRMPERQRGFRDRLLSRTRRQQRALKAERDEARWALSTLADEVSRSTSRLSLGADLVSEQDHLLHAVGVAERVLPPEMLGDGAEAPSSRASQCPEPTTTTNEGTTL